MIKERSSLIFVLRAMFLSFHITLRFASAPVAWAILESISGLDHSSMTMAPRYLKLLTVSNFSPLTLMVLLMPLMLFFISLVFSALICMSYAVEVLSSRSS